ncbi:MAG: hypothetical protein AUI60_01255 [Thaumarchaeota archaeon 13_1_40CM_2_39_4]|nr:MAG: hypothetical protein AUI92_04615 [Thaumarchaeota archaeon 13_1_40CM_3_38_6]OLD41563.1 MAG: hypothetical protein AUI60_01255 [Thaumarchaeota archaeon 13_1_40CM_2_39_4]
MDRFQVIKDTPMLTEKIALWIKWQLEQERDVNPANDLTGQRAARNQKDRDVWFLTGSFGNNGTIVRDVTVPAGKNVLVEGASSDCSFAEGPPFANTIQDLKDRANAICDLHKNIKVVIDDKAYEIPTAVDKNKKRVLHGDLERVETDPIAIVFPEDNGYKDKYLVKGGATVLVCCAWAMLVTFDAGKHTVSLHAEHEADKELKVGPFRLDVFYNLDVEQNLGKLF